MVGDLHGHRSLLELELDQLGNHELMLLNFLHCYASRLHSRKSFPSGGGEWINEAISKNRLLSDETICIHKGPHHVVPGQGRRGTEVGLARAVDPAINGDPRFCAQVLWLLFAPRASVTRSAPLHRRTNAARPYAAAMTTV